MKISYNGNYRHWRLFVNNKGILMARKLRNRLLALVTERELKIGRRIKYVEIAEATGLANSIISRWMNGKVENYESRVVEKLCDYFECELWDLLVLEEVEDGTG
jgi:putative transcriptional regulator